jgi:hypothetical protein
LSEGSKTQNASVRRIEREHGLPPLLYTPPITKRLPPDRDNMPSAIHFSLIVVFLSREAAKRFARRESPHEHFAVVQVPDGLEFGYAV